MTEKKGNFYKVNREEQLHLFKDGEVILLDVRPAEE
jgi:hypothetical protein